MTALTRTRARVQITRPNNATMAYLAFSVGFFLSHGPVAWASFALGLAIIYCVHSATTIQNDLEDFEIDRLNHSKTPLHTGALSYVEAQRLERGFMLAAVLLGALGPIRHLWFVAASLALGWLYNKPPWRLSRRPLGSMAIMGLAYAAAPLVYGYTAAGHQVDVTIGILALLWAIRRVSVSILKDYKDVTGDRALHKQTFLLAYDYKLTGLASVWLSWVAAIGLGWFSLVLRPLSWLAAVPAALLVHALWRRLRLTRIHDSRSGNEVFGAVVPAENRFDLAYVLWLVIV